MNIKKTLLFTFLSLQICTAYAQQAESLRFMGISMDQPKEIRKHLKEKGFKPQQKGEGAVWSGQFFMANSTVTLDEQEGKVRRATVRSQKTTWWTDLEGRYRSIKAGLTAKYGRPAEAYEAASGDGAHPVSEMIPKLYSGEVMFRSLWRIADGKDDGGVILLAITKNMDVELIYANRAGGWADGTDERLSAIEIGGLEDL